MASVEKDGQGYRVRFIDHNKERKTIRLSGINKANATTVAHHVQQLVNWKKSGLVLDSQTADWIAKKVGQELYDKLANAGLIEAREASTLGMFLKGYLLRRDNVKPATLRKWQSAVNHLIEHLGDNRDLRSVNAGHADEFRSFLYKQSQEENTVRRYCGLAKQFFRAAQRRKLIDENPFSDQVSAVTGNAAKFHFISREDTTKILKACPDLQWRLIVSLARFGGLRCPSEILALNWEDIDWQGKRFTVTSSKTEHHEGGASRVVPLFPELVEILNEGYELEFHRLNGDESETETVGVVSGPVITRYRDSNQNLRTTFLKIIKRAGLKAWPKLFQNLRSTRETELAEKFPLQAVTSWMGNSQLVAAKHYLQLRDEHFDRATMETAETTKGGLGNHEGQKLESQGHRQGHNAPETTETDKPSKAKNPAKTNVLRGSPDECAYLRPQRMGAEGLEAFPPNMEKQGGNTVKDSRPKIPGAQAGAIETETDCQGQLKASALDDLQRAWKSLRRLQDSANSPAESKAVGRAVALVDKAFTELERSE